MNRTDLSNARIVMRAFEDGSGELYIRGHRNAPSFLEAAVFAPAHGIAEKPMADRQLTAEQLVASATDTTLTILASFPKPTLQELYGQYDAVRYKTPVGNLRLAQKLEDGKWIAMGYLSAFDDLDEMAQMVQMLPGTIVPLIIDPAWLEAQR